MQLNNTIILPGDNPQLSEKLLRSLIEKQDVVTVVIFGRDPVAEDAVQKADLRASAIVSGITRKVAWMQDTGMLPLLKTLIKAGAGGTPDSVNTDIHIGIAISMTDVLMSVIPKTPAVDYIRMEQAFIKASTI